MIYPIKCTFTPSRFSVSSKKHSPIKVLRGNSIIVTLSTSSFDHVCFDYIDLIIRGPLPNFKGGGDIIHDLNHIHCLYCWNQCYELSVFVFVIVPPDVIYPLQRETMGNTNTSPERNPSPSSPLPTLPLSLSFLSSSPLSLSVIPAYVSLFLTKHCTSA